MNLSQIEVIVEIAKAGSISKAAQNLYISQPGVSKILQKFEEEVGFQIFERVTTGVRMTPTGRRLVENARDIMDQVKMLEQTFNRNLVVPAMELNIASMSYQFMQCMVRDLCKKYSQNPVSIRYIECGFDEEVERVSKGDIEIAVIIFWKDHLRKSLKKMLAKGVEYHRVGSAVPYVGVSKDSRRYPAELETVELERLAKMPMITISPSEVSAAATMSGWDFLRMAFGMELGEFSNQEIIVNNTGTMQEMVRQLDGFSLILINPGIYSRYGYSDTIRLIPIQGAEGQFELGWLQRTNTVRFPLANDFISMLRESATDD